MKNLLINLLFKLLGNSYTQSFSIQYLFGLSTISHDARKKKWENALVRMWKDKDMLDFLFYQSESDKEQVFKGKINANLSKGARIRTLFLVYSAHKAFQQSLKKKGIEIDEDKKISDTYKNLVDVSED